MRVIILLLLAVPAFGQVVSSTPATIMAGFGAPTAQTPSIPCNVGAAGVASTSLYDDQSITAGNSIWKCKLLPDRVTYSWVAPFSAPVAIITSTAIPTSQLTSFGCGTIGPITVPGALTTMGVFTSVTGATSVSQITNLYTFGLVTAANTVMLAYCNYSLGLLTPASGLFIRYGVQ